MIDRDKYSDYLFLDQFEEAVTAAMTMKNIKLKILKFTAAQCCAEFSIKFIKKINLI